PPKTTHSNRIFAGYLRSLSLQCRRPGAFGVVAGKQRPEVSSLEPLSKRAILSRYWRTLSGIRY
ncbi:hypothetical protein ACUNHV_25980, partial [Serratia sp. IR-2025]